MKLINKAFLVSTFALAASMPAQADFVLDTFTYKDAGGSVITNYPADDYPGLFDKSYFTVFADADPYQGNDVDLYLENLPSVLQAQADYDFNGPLANTPVVTSGNGKLDYSSGTQDPASSLTITYGRIAPLNFYDFGSYLYVDVIELDVNPDNGGMTVSVSAASASGTSSWTQTYTTNLVYEYILVPFTAFVTDSGTGVDWSAVIGSSITFANAGGAVDFTLEEFGVVPAPAALGILGLGLIGVGLSRRKKLA